MWKDVKADYIRHGRSLTEPAFVSLAIYRYGRFAISLRNPALRWIASKGYGALKVLILNVTKVWIPPECRIGEDFHIIHAEGSLCELFAEEPNISKTSSALSRKCNHFAGR